MTEHLYVVTNRLNGKRYVGITNNPERRWHDHQHCARRGSRYLLHQALVKHGIEQFTFEVKESFQTRDEAIRAEALLIQEMNTLRTGYNLSEGGAAPTLSSESRAKLSASLKKYYESPEARKKTGDAQRGKRKIRRKQVEPGCGRRQTDETRRKISETWARKRDEKESHGKIE